MKHVITFLMLSAALTTQAQNLFIAKVASPSDEKTNGKFVTLYNPTADTIDFETTTYYLAKETNGGGTISNKKLVGKIAPSAYYVIAGKSVFKDIYSKDPDCVAGCVTGNGNDAYMLYINGDQLTGTLVDIYGELGVDGLGLDWDYTDALATRNNTTQNGLSNWNKNEWVITRDLLATNANPWNSSETTSLHNQTNKLSNIIFASPNPCHQSINIESKYQILNISVTSLSGQIWYQEKELANTEIDIDCTRLPEGIYFITVQLVDGTTCSLRIVKR